MLTLHDAVDMTKRGLLYGVVGLIGIIILVFLFNIIKAVFKGPPPGPTVAFGKLEPIPFPQNSTSRDFSYGVNTASGELPIFPDRVSIYKLTQIQPSLLSLSIAKQNAQAVGFKNGPTKLNETDYGFTTDQPFPRRLILNIFTSDFDYTSDYQNDNHVVSGDNLPLSDVDAIVDGKTFMSGLGGETGDLVAGQPLGYFQLQGNQLIAVPTINAARLIKINYFQSDVDKLKIYYPGFPDSPINALIAGGDQQPQVVEAHFYHRGINTKQGSTYPIKTAQEAFDSLKSGNSYISSYDGTSGEISITGVSLGYFINRGQNYLLPVVVFSGKDNFYAFVPALKDAWVKK